MPPILGIHHVTAIGTDPQRNLDFYTEVLGLRLVKKTVNFDDPSTYHFYFGDGAGAPGTILTFFPWPGARRGSRGTGQATVTSFAVPADSLGTWEERLRTEGVVVGGTEARFNEEALTLLDPDGLKLEIVAVQEAAALPFWEAGPVSGDHAIRGFHGVTLALEGFESTAELLTDFMGLRRAAEERNRFRFTAGEHGPGAIVDLLCSPGTPRGNVAAGTVHHVAFRVESDEDQAACREQLVALGMNVSPVLDRNYFRSMARHRSQVTAMARGSSRTDRG
jgi:glyoxalase family protein